MRSRVRVQRVQHGRSLFNLRDQIHQQSELEKFAVKLLTAKEVFVVWRKGTLLAVTPEEYISRKEQLPAGARAFLERGEAEAWSAEMKKRAGEETRGGVSPTRRS